MGTHGEDSEVAILHPERQQDQPGLGFSSSEEAALVDKFQNVGFRSHYGGCGTDDFSAPIFPLRPYASDCIYYLKTSICKFGQQCKFNHPLKRTGVVVKEKGGKDSEKIGQRVECKYYLTEGGCKYGKFCRYSHSKDGSDNTAPLLNSLGLPMRVGEKECPHYMRHGSCGYGAHCVFHHPEPSSIGELNAKSLRLSGNTMGSLGQSALLQLSGASQHHQASWSSYPLPGSKFSYQDDNSRPAIANSFPQEAHRHLEPNQYLGPQLPYQMSTPAHLTPGGANRADMLQPIVTIKAEEFPERPGQPECAYFMKTGHCKFKYTCRFHHPKGQLECLLLSEKGLPLRPGRSVCRHYERFGACKFGRECLFDHPVDQNSTGFQDRSSSKPASGHDSGSWSE